MSNPESYEDLVELLVPVLQERGLMWKDYAVPGGTYRENMLRLPGQPYTTKGHASRDFTFENLKQFMDEDGEITINREDPPVAASPEKVDEAVSLTEAVNGVKLSEKSETVKETVVSV